MTYSLDFRLQALSIKEKNDLSFAETAERFGVGIASIVRWSKKPEPQLTRNKPSLKINMDALKEDIMAYPDAYQYERAERLGVSRTGIWYALKRLHVTYKKTLKHPKADSEKRSAFCQAVQEYREAGHAIVL